MVQALKESPVQGIQFYQRMSKILMVYDAIQTIKQLRRDVVNAMQSLMRLAKEKETSGMLPICEDMISKTRILLSLWDPGLVEEALAFLEENRLAKVHEVMNNQNSESINQSVSPYKRINQQLNFDIKTPDLYNFVASSAPEGMQDIWGKKSFKNKYKNLTMKNEINYNVQNQHSNGNFVIFPKVDDEFNETNMSESIKKQNFKFEDNSNRKLEDEENSNVNSINDLDLSKRFLDTQKMCNSPSANYYKPTDEPEPWDLTQLNIEASVMCLVSKVKFLCGRCRSPAARIHIKNEINQDQYLKSYLENDRINSTNIVTTQPKIGIKSEESSKLLGGQKTNTNNDKQTTAMNTLKEGVSVFYYNSSSNKVSQAMDSVSQILKSNSSHRNKFTDGLDFASIMDWTSELRPSMKKLRQAMDGLLKTARLTHSVFRIQEDGKNAQHICNVRYRRDVCFSQALTALVSGLMAKFWCQKPDPIFLLILTTLGPLISFEGLLSYYGDEIDMWGDMTVAIEDMHTVTFILSRNEIHASRIDGKQNITQFPLPKVVGSRTALTVLLPVPDTIYSLFPLIPSFKRSLSFTVTPVFFNIGINEMASLAESLGTTKPQAKSNMDNFDRLNEYYLRFKKLNLPTELTSTRLGTRLPVNQTLTDMMNNLKTCIQINVNKNIDVLQLSSQICRRMRGLRFTSCKSAKDRTGMSITLEQVNILSTEYHLAEHELSKALDCMRSEGCRRENTWKNIGVKKYAFNSLQIMTLPKLYRPPTGTYGSAQT